MILDWIRYGLIRVDGEDRLDDWMIHGKRSWVTQVDQIRWGRLDRLDRWGQIRLHEVRLD
jgi:hypothetical protein